MYIFTYPREEFEKKGINKADIKKLIDKHKSIVNDKYKVCEGYYNGIHKVLGRTKQNRKAPNNKIVCNHARYITDIATGYFMSNPISYQIDEGDLGKLTDVFDIADVDSADIENAMNMSKFGLSYEFVYIKEATNEIAIKVISPENCFIVRDDSIEENELFAVYYYIKKNDVGNKVKYMASVFTADRRYDMELEQGGNNDRDIAEAVHYFEGIPIIEYLNNIDGIGDYEQQISLIDAYNILTSDRLNDKEQFLNALLVIKGAMLTDGEENTSEAIKGLKELGLLEIPEGASVEYLTKTFDENSVEVLRKAIEEDIHKFSYVPCLTDESFAGNTSGVAMEYKLLGLEMITKIKTKQYRKGLKKRIRLFCNFLGKKGTSIDYESVVPVFARGLPKNTTELAQMVATLNGMVSQETLLNQLPFVEDTEGEIEALNDEKDESFKRQQEFMASKDNEPLGGEDIDEE